MRRLKKPAKTSAYAKAPSKAALAWADRNAHHLATQGDLQALRVINATGNNLKGVSVAFPVGLLTCVTGVSGSGKSTLVNDTLYTAVARQLYRAHEEPAAHEEIQGIEHFDKVINVDQSPIGRTPRSNPATYTGMFTPIRELMAEMNLAKERGYGAGSFSFNVAGGRCEACQGDGVKKVEMHFLPDVYVPCDVCVGMRYNRETLEVMFKGKNIAQILDLTVEAAFEFFKTVPVIARKLQTLLDVGLVVHQTRPIRHHALRRRGAARQTGAGTKQTRHRPHAVHPGRADHRPAFCRYRPAAQSAAPAARRRQHHCGD